MEQGATFTVCTPVYNDADRLDGLYRSLEAQTFRDFEWIIVDDGSNEESGVPADRYAASASFSVRVIRKKKHRGTHTAVNRAVDEAHGTFFLVLRTDEELFPHTLRSLLSHWHSIPIDERPYFASVAGLTQNSDGSIRGDRFPSSPFDSTRFEAGGRYGISGRKWGFLRTGVFRKNPYPELAGERYCPEGLVLNRIGLRYLTRYVNEAMVTVHPSAESELRSQSADLPFPSAETALRGPGGSALYFLEQLSLPIPLARKIRASLAYVRYSLHAGKLPDDLFAEAPKKLLVFFSLPPGYFLYKRDLARGKKAT